MEFATFKVEDGRSLDRVGASSLYEEEEDDDDDDLGPFKSVVVENVMEEASDVRVISLRLIGDRL